MLCCLRCCFRSADFVVVVSFVVAVLVVAIVVVLVVTEHVASGAGRGVRFCLLAGGGAKLNEFWLPHTAKRDVASVGEMIYAKEAARQRERVGEGNVEREERRRESVIRGMRVQRMQPRSLSNFIVF